MRCCKPSATNTPSSPWTAPLCCSTTEARSTNHLYYGNRLNNANGKVRGRGCDALSSHPLAHAHKCPGTSGSQSQTTRWGQPYHSHRTNPPWRLMCWWWASASALPRCAETNHEGWRWPVVVVVSHFTKSGQISSRTNKHFVPDEILSHFVQ